MSHSGRDRTWQKMRERVYFHGGSLWVRQKTKECVTCSQIRNGVWPAQVAPLRPIPVTPLVFWRVHIDLFGPLPPSRNGNRHGVLGVDAFTKYLEGRRNFSFLRQYTRVRNSFLKNADLAAVFARFKFPATPDPKVPTRTRTRKK